MLQWMLYHLMLANNNFVPMKSNNFQLEKFKRKHLLKDHSSQKKKKKF